MRQADRSVRVTAIAAIVAGSVAAAPSVADEAGASAAVGSYPLVVLCTVRDQRLLIYLDRVQANGDAVYINFSRQGGIFLRSGPPPRFGPDAPGDCANKSLDGLDDAGQVMVPAAR